MAAVIVVSPPSLKNCSIVQPTSSNERTVGFHSKSSGLFKIDGRRSTNCFRQRRPNFEIRSAIADLDKPLSPLTVKEPTPVLQIVKAFAPATVANLGVGFDFLGCAVTGLGDYVTAEICKDTAPGTVSIKSITGDNGRLGYVPSKNCAGIAGQATMDLLGIRTHGVALSLHKGLPLGSGLGSSAASAAAAAVAVNALFGSPLTKQQLIEAGLRSEAAVSGYHADNVAPSLLGGFVLIRSYDPLEIYGLQFPEDKDLFFVLAIPEFEAPTQNMRKVLPDTISVKKHLKNSSQAASLVASIFWGDVPLLGSALGSDLYAEPARGGLIPGFFSVKQAATDAGGYGCTISGAGPTAVAIADNEVTGEAVRKAMVEAYVQHGKLAAKGWVQKLDMLGARVVPLDHPLEHL